MESKFKRAFTRTTAVLFAALLLATSAYVPQVAQVVPTDIVASAAGVTVVTTEDDLKTAFAVGSEVKLGADISITSNDIENSIGEVTLDLNGHKIELGSSTCFIVHQTLTITDSSDDHTGTVMQSNNRVPFKLQTDSSTLDIKGGNYIVTNGNYSGTANLASGLEGSTVNISGGSFNVYDIVAEPVTASVSGGTFTEDASEYVTDGAKQIQDGNNYVVLKFQYTDGTDCWGLTEDGTLYLFGEVKLSEGGYYGWRSYLTNIKKVVALTSAKAGDSFQNAFADCSSLKEADLSKLTISNTTNLSYMFCNCSNLTKVTMSNNTANVTNMAAMFYGCSSLQTVDVSKWKTDNVTNMNSMFSNCSSLQTVDVSKWNTNNVTDMNSMFSNCSSLQTVDVSKWKTDSVTVMSSMFNTCSALTSLDLSGWDTTSVQVMDSAFDNCINLSSLTVGEKVSIPLNANLPNKYNSDTGLVDGWYDADGKLISGESDYAVISEQSGTLRRGTKDFTNVTVGDIDDQLYTGEAVTPDLTVKEGTTELVKDTDYKVTFADNTEIGKATANVIGIGDYVGKVTKTFEIIKSDISNATIGELEDVIYTGEAFTPAVTVTLNGNTLTKDTDYTVEYTDNTDAGTATVTVTGTGTYTGTVKKTFKILNLFDVSGLDNAIEVKVYDTDENEVAASAGKYVVEPGYTITSKAALIFEGVKTTKYDPDETGNPYADNYTYEVTRLTANIGKASHKHNARVSTDYRLLVECDTEAGSSLETLAELTVHGDGTYKYGEKIEITQDNLGKNEAYKTAAEKYGNKGPIEFLGKPAFQENTPNNEDWDGNVRTDIGSYRVNTGAKFLNATYYLFKNYEITAKDVAELTAYVDLDGAESTYSETIETELPTITYDGKTYTPTAKLVYKDFWDGTDTLTDKTLELDKDYTVEISAGQNAGEYQIVFTGKGNFTGTKTVTWNIENANMTLVDDNQGQAYQFVYNGANTVNTAAFKVSGAPEGAQATYTYFSDTGLQLPSAPTTVGSYRVKITYAKANYNTADITLNFNVTKRPVTLTPAADQKITYGEAIPTEIRYTVEAANGDRGLVAGDEITGNLIAVVGTGILNAGTYDYVLVDSECDFENYTVTLNSDSKFTVEKKALTKDMFTVSPTSLDYTGRQQTVAVNGSDSIGIQLNPGDFEMPVSNPDSQYMNLLAENDWSIVGNTNRATNAGTYVVKVKASDNGNYTGEIELDNDNQKWTINSKSMSSVDILVLAPDQTYTGSDITETVTVKDGTTPLVEGTDYEIITEKIGDKYTDAQSLTQKLAGTYTFYIKGKGNYADDIKGTWQITSADIYSVKVAGGSKTYDGKPVTEKDFRITTKLTETSAKDPNADIKYNFVFKKNGEVVTDPTDAGTYTVEVTAYDEKGSYQSKTVGADGDIIFTIAKRKVELYPTEGQSAEYGTDVAGLSIAYTTEVADEESITGLLPTDTVDFSSALTIEFGEETPVPVGFYPIKINEAIDFGNYQAVKGEDVEFEITKATLKDDWFAVYLDEDLYVDHTFDGKNIKVKVVEVNGSLEQNKDFTATGDFEAYLPGTYTITVKGKGNYQGKVTKTWKIDANKTVTASTTVATEESSDVHVYDGEAPAVNVVPNDAENPLPEFTDVTYDYYVKDTATGEWTKLTAAPTDAGSYKVQGNAASKGYEIEVSAKEYTIAKKPILITIDPKDLTGTYGQETFTIPYTVAEDAIIEKDKANGVAVSGEIVVNAAGKDTGVLEIDFSGVTVNSTNYELVFPENTTFTLAPKQLKDENIVFENASADLHDIGTTRITYRVVVNGKELVEGTDYEASGTTEADEAGTYKVQIVGKGNFAGFAEAAWTLAYNEEARNAALEAIAENVTASFKSDDNGIAATAAFTGGKRKVTVTAAAALKDGLEEGDKYTVTRTGMVYYNGDMEGFDTASLTVDNADGVTMFDAGRNNIKEYKYGMIDVNKGIVAKAYAVVNDGSYETVVYSDAVTLNYDELIRYSVKVNGGTILATGEKEAQYSGTDIQQNKPFVRVTVDAAEIPEDQQFLCWTKNGVVASYAETFSFYMSEKDTVVTALYADKDEEIEKLAVSYMDSITLLPDENKFKCVTMSSVPSDCTILKSGLIFTSDTITDPDEFNSEKYASTVRGNATTAHNYRYTWTKSNVGEGTYYVRSYVKYTDANGAEKETYGDVYKISMNGYEML